MRLLRNENVILIMQNTLNCVDPRLVDHGKRVAWLVFKVLRLKNTYSAKQLRDICTLTMLHDIGAYRTEEIEKMVIFETIDIWEHSIYGYLFLKYFSPLRDLSQAILYHHADCKEVSILPSPLRELAQLISLCDRADVFLHSSENLDSFYRYIEKKRNIKFSSDAIDSFLKAEINLSNIDNEIAADEDFQSIFYEEQLSENEVNDYIKMIVFSIDFRSRQTFTHTIATASIAHSLATLSGADKSGVDKIITGAMLHDIGKTGIPLNILESPSRLNDIEMKIMMTHVDLTEKIIANCVDEETMKLAVHHHEKLNKTGYPRKIGSSDISFNERILIISDIFSALYGVRSYKDSYQKDKIADILIKMSKEGLIDSEIVSMSIENFDFIIQKLNEELESVINAYNAVNDEYLLLKKYHIP